MSKKIIESQIVDTTIVVDGASGEVLHEETRTQTASKIIRTYGDGFFIVSFEAEKYMDGLSGSQRRMITLLMKEATYANHEEYPLVVKLNAETKKDIIEKCGLSSMSSIDNTLSLLIKRKVLRRLKPYHFQFNPFLFAKGKFEDIEKVRETWVDYLDDANDTKT